MRSQMGLTIHYRLSKEARWLEGASEEVGTLPRARSTSAWRKLASCGPSGGKTATPNGGGRRSGSGPSSTPRSGSAWAGALKSKRMRLPGRAFGGGASKRGRARSESSWRSGSLRILRSSIFPRGAGWTSAPGWLGARDAKFPPRGSGAAGRLRSARRSTPPMSPYGTGGAALSIRPGPRASGSVSTTRVASGGRGTTQLLPLGWESATRTSPGRSARWRASRQTPTAVLS